MYQIKNSIQNVLFESIAVSKIEIIQKRSSLPLESRLLLIDNIAFLVKYSPHNSDSFPLQMSTDDSRQIDLHDCPV